MVTRRRGATRPVKALGASWRWAVRQRRVRVLWIVGALLFLASFAVGLSLVNRLVDQATGGGSGGSARGGASPAERPTGESALIQQIKQQVAQIRQTLGEAEFDALWADGRALTTEQIVAYVASLERPSP